MANAGSESVTPIEVATSEPGAEIKVGSGPEAIAITPDGKTAYVTNAGSDSVTPIELATNKPSTEIKVGSTPDGIAITPDGKTAYVTNESSDSVTPIELATNTPGAEINVGVNPTAIAITPDGKTAYVTNIVSGSVTPIELATSTPGAEINVGLEPGAIAITPDGKTAYVGNYAGASVTPIELATNTPGAGINVSEPAGIAITPDGKTAYVTNHATESVTPIELATNEPGAEIKVGELPDGIAITPAVVTKKPTRLTTALSGEGQSGGTITVKEGAAVTDSSTLSGENTATASGTVTYKLYSDSRCTEEVASAGQVSVTAGLVPASEAKTLAAGTYYWQASYGGDSLNEASKSTCGSEVETVEAAVVTKKPTTLTTTLSGEGNTGQTITVKEGAAVTDSSTLSGENTATASGTVTYKLYSDSRCTKLVKEAGAVTVVGGVVPESSAQTLAAGTYYWQASYDGDETNEKSSSTCGSEVETVQSHPTQPHWYSNGTLIPEGQVEPVSSSGNLTLQVPGSKLSVTCKLKDEATIVNPAGGGAGTDETTEVVFSSCSGKASPCSSRKTSWCCKKKSSSPCEKGSRIELSSPGGPLRTHLVAVPGQPVRDVIEGVVLEVRCSNGTVLDTYKGTLMPTVGNSVLKFDAGSGELEDPAGAKATVSGADWLEGPLGAEWITVANPEREPW